MTANPIHLGLAHALAELEPADFIARLRPLDPARRDDAIRHRLRVDRRHFLRHLWPEYYAYRPFAPYHLDILGREKVGWLDRRGCGHKILRALAAPRSTSKTGIIRGDIAHDVIYGLEAVIPVLSATLPNSIQTLARLRKMLTSPKVRALYGDVTIVGGATRWTATNRDGHTTTLIAKSFGTEVRGLDDEVRPTRIVVDDGENKLEVDNPDNRRKWWSFLMEDIAKLGDIGGGLIIDWLGTVLHPDAVLARLLDPKTGAGWTSHRYQACEKWPDGPQSAALWEACRLIWCNLDIGDTDERRAAALAFYGEHRAEMDHGARMLSDDWINLFSFYEAIWAEGIGSVLKELQNTPRDPSASVFTSATFPRCRLLTMPDGEPAVQRLLNGAPEGNLVRRRDLRVILRLDPIPADEQGGLGGGAGGSDFAVIGAIGTDPAGRAYALDAVMGRMKDSEQIGAFWTLGEKWHPWKAICESNGFQRLLGGEFRRQQADRAAKGLWNAVRLDEAKNSISKTNKANDIAKMEPVIQSGWYYFADHLPTEGMLQWDDHPNGTHDDFPDVFARGYFDAKGAASGMVAQFGRG